MLTFTEACHKSLHIFLNKSFTISSLRKNLKCTRTERPCWGKCCLISNSLLAQRINFCGGEPLMTTELPSTLRRSLAAASHHN